MKRGRTYIDELDILVIYTYQLGEPETATDPEKSGEMEITEVIQAGASVFDLLEAVNGLEDIENRLWELIQEEINGN